MKILLVEDDETVIKVLTKHLNSNHYVVDIVKDGEMGWTYGSTFEYDLMLLDIMLPKLDGISLCKRFRSEGYATPILLLTAQDTRSVKVQGLDAGADDYVVKPFDPVELIARIRALMRRGSANPFPLLTWGELLLNPSTCEVSYSGQPLALTTKEYELLELLLRHSQYVFSSDELIDRLWSSEEFPSDATVRSHIRRVRQKLVAAGAPTDFIATMHGRGYYLKAPAQVTERQPDSQQQYLDFLNQTWLTTKPKSLDQTTALFQIVGQLQANRLTPEQQDEAQRIAHTLVGTLGIFGLTKPMHLARQLEHWLGGSEPLQAKHVPLLKTLITSLQQDIQNTGLIESNQFPEPQSPLLLLISSDAEFNQSLLPVATHCGIQIETLPTLEAAYAMLQSSTTPSIILLRLPLDSALELDSQAQSTQLETLQGLARRTPVLVMGEPHNLSDRLEILRRGVKLFLEALTPPEQVMAAVVNLLKGGNLPAKVMIVDDDPVWLNTLPTLLKPWGLKVTTLADPQQFWPVLEAVTPDMLVLDVKMPQINGFELCQILRSDPQWQRLPVLFLSVLNDAASQNQAFTVGADDYICKPVMGVALANRILSRLHRVRAYAS